MNYKKPEQGEKGDSLGDYHDDVKSMMLLNAAEDRAFDAMSTGNYRLAHDLLVPMVRFESIYTVMTLAWLYESGLSGVIDKDQSMAYYKRAADLGEISANYRVGLLKIEQGDEQGARASFLRGTNLGHLASMTKLAEMMIEGQGGDSEVDDGLELMTNSAKCGHFIARRKLLSFEASNAKSLVKKILIKFAILRLAREAAEEFKSDKFSDKIEGLR